MIEFFRRVMSYLGSEELSNRKIAFQTDFLRDNFGETGLETSLTIFLFATMARPFVVAGKISREDRDLGVGLGLLLWLVASLPRKG
jgi:hypothetical protein